MSDLAPADQEFSDKLTSIIEEHIAQEQFGVAELADKMNMSRSNLLRKVKKATGFSVAQLIRELRLKKAMILLRESAFNVSEISGQVGFGSVSYFIKCFRERYGYPPGEAAKHAHEDITTVEPTPPSKKNLYLLAGMMLLVTLAVAGFAYMTLTSSKHRPAEKSIAVLPFKNDSNDSTNVYFINGLMESTLNNLQKIQDLKVISRTSTEKYRNTNKSIPEMAEELHVKYFVEGSGQKIGDQIFLSIQLIEASSDKHLLSRQYKRQIKDIFQLQQEVAKSIADQIQVVITAEERGRIEKNPTDNVAAYDVFLKGVELSSGKHVDFPKAVAYFKEAIELDPQFALAHAGVAVCDYYRDAFLAEQKLTGEIEKYADRALLLDPTLTESLVAKGLSFLQKKEYESAIPYFEKALEYNPNSVLAIGFLSDFYANNLPNTEKYLKYSLKGVQLDPGSKDSVTASYLYLRLSNALIQTGFVDESLRYINKSLDLNPKNPFSSYVKAFILFAKTRNCNQTKMLLVKEFNKDTTRFDILQDIGKLCYLSRDYDSAYFYYRRFIDIRKARQLDVYRHENLRIAHVLKVQGKEGAEELLASFKEYADNDRSIYKELSLAGYYAQTGDKAKTMEHARLFLKEDNYQYWILLIDMDPDFDLVKDDPEFKEIVRQIQKKFWASHDRIHTMLEENGLM